MLSGWVYHRALFASTSLHSSSSRSISRGRTLWFALGPLSGQERNLIGLLLQSQLSLPDLKCGLTSHSLLPRFLDGAPHLLLRPWHPWLGEFSEELLAPRPHVSGRLRSHQCPHPHSGQHVQNGTQSGSHLSNSSIRN